MENRRKEKKGKNKEKNMEGRKMKEGENGREGGYKGKWYSTMQSRGHKSRRYQLQCFCRCSYIFSSYPTGGSCFFKAGGNPECRKGEGKKGKKIKGKKEDKKTWKEDERRRRRKSGGKERKIAFH